MELDVKTILIAIVVLTICVLICFFGIKSVNNNSLTENIAINQENKVNNNTTSVSRIEKNEENIINSFVENQNDNNKGKLIERNNKPTHNANSITSTYLRREVDYSRMDGKTLCYKIPEEWNISGLKGKDSKTGADIHTHFLKLEEFGNFSDETTYEEFLPYFVVKEKEYDYTSIEDFEYRTRNLKIDDLNEITIIDKWNTYSVTSYVVLVIDNGVYWLSIEVSKDDYNDEFVKIADSILSTVYVIDF